MPVGSFQSILLFKLRYVGDVILTTPAIRSIRSAYPSARITMVVNKGTEDAIKYNPNLDSIVTIDRDRIERAGWFRRMAYQMSLIRSVRSRRPDLVVDFASGERAAVLALLSGAATRIGFRRKSGLRRLLYNRQVVPSDRTHTVENNLMLVEQTLNLDRGDDRLELYTSPEDDRRIDRWLVDHGLADSRFVVIHPGGRYWSKRWPAEKWAALVDLLQRESKVPVVIAGGENEQHDVRTIMSLVKTPPYSVVGETTVLELAALCRRASLLIGNDSGPAHIAAAVGTRVIALFGPTDPCEWRPWGPGHVVISQVSSPQCVQSDRAGTDGHPAVQPRIDTPVCPMDGCEGGSICRGIHTIAVDRVYAEAAKLLGAR